MAQLADQQKSKVIDCEDQPVSSTGSASSGSVINLANFSPEKRGKLFQKRTSEMADVFRGATIAIDDSPLLMRLQRSSNQMKTR